MSTLSREQGSSMSLLKHFKDLRVSGAHLSDSMARFEVAKLRLEKTLAILERKHMDELDPRPPTRQDYEVLAEAVRRFLNDISS